MPRAEPGGGIVLHPPVDGASALLLAAAAAHAAPGARFVTVIPVDDVTDLDGLLVALGTVAAEVVLTGGGALTTEGLSPATEVALARKGEDFVFTVADLPEAVRWAAEAAHRPDIEGERVLVVGSSVTLGEVRAAVADAGRRFPLPGPRPAGPGGAEGGC